MKKIKKIKNIICFGIGLFFLLGAVVMITRDITATIFFGIVAIIFLFLGRGLFLDIINNLKINRLENELNLTKLNAENELNKQKIELQKDLELKKLELERQKIINQLQLENQKQLSANKELINIENLPDGYAFEEYTANLLKKLNYTNVSVTSSSNDYGIDVLAEKDGIKYAIQCKLYSQPVGNKAVQEAFSGKNYYNCHIAVVLTNNTFTENAKKLAQSNGVLLWDKDVLQKMIEETSVKTN